jgi:hypothetical protein
LDEYYVRAFLACFNAIQANALINREGRDKEFHFQNWFKARLREAGLKHDEGGRNTYPDYTLVEHAGGFELKALAYPGREFDFDSNSQVPAGIHNGREIFYVFGRYPADPDDPEAFPVIDLVMCHGNFLNAASDYTHKNKSAKGFGSYGDINIRDRKMYVVRTPYGLATGLFRNVTLIAEEEVASGDLVKVGTLVRKEVDKLLAGYEFSLKTNELKTSFIPNPNAGKEHKFFAYRCKGATSETGTDVNMKAADQSTEEGEALPDL